MRIRRRLPILFGFVLVVAAIALAVVLRKHAPPEPARLLPGADGYFYANLKWIRRANIAGQMPDVPHEPEYEQFIQATGFQFERDLDQAAFAIHYPPVKAERQSWRPRAGAIFGSIRRQDPRGAPASLSGEDLRFGGELQFRRHLQYPARGPHPARGGSWLRHRGGLQS